MKWKSTHPVNVAVIIRMNIVGSTPYHITTYVYIYLYTYTYKELNRDRQTEGNKIIGKYETLSWKAFLSIMPKAEIIKENIYIIGMQYF